MLNLIKKYITVENFVVLITVLLDYLKKSIKQINFIYNKLYELTPYVLAIIKKTVNNFLYLTEETLGYILKLVRILSKFTTDILNVLKPLFVFIFSYKSLLKTAIYLGILSKTTVVLPASIIMLLPPSWLTFLSEYSVFVTNLFLFTTQNLQRARDFIDEYKQYLLNTEELKKKISSLESALNDKTKEFNRLKEEFSKKESYLKATINQLESSLDIQKDKNNRFLLLNEELQNQLSKSNSLSNLNTFFSIMSTLLQITSMSLTMLNIISGGKHNAENEEILAILRTLRTTIENYQRNQVNARASARATGADPQLTDGSFTSLDDT